MTLTYYERNVAGMNKILLIYNNIFFLNLNNFSFNQNINKVLIVQYTRTYKLDLNRYN